MKRGGKRSGAGRPKGAVAPTTKLLRDAVLQAGEDAGGKGGLVGYLTEQARENPNAFMGLLGKVLPLQVSGEDGGPLVVEIVRFGAEGQASA